MLNPTQQEIFDFLKQNLEIGIEILQYPGSPRVKVDLYLCGEQISSDIDEL